MLKKDSIRPATYDCIFKKLLTDEDSKPFLAKLINLVVGLDYKEILPNIVIGNPELLSLHKDEKNSSAFAATIYNVEEENEKIRKAIINTAKIESHEEGIEEGIEIGIEQGITQGTDQDIKDAQIKIIFNMLKKRMNENMIAEITGIDRNTVFEISKKK